MQSQILSFLISAGAVTLAEMGDKTQLLAMAFASKYKAGKVMIGVFIATVLNHALAVAVGSLLTRFAALSALISALAALSFLFFGLWTIRGDKLEGEENRTSRFGAVATVAIAFFIAELGDKTQLATIALAARYPEHPVFVLLGTTTGMLIADGIGVLVGVVLCKKIPQRTVKLVSAGAFVVFGLIGCFEVARSSLGLGIAASLGIVAVLAAVTLAIGLRLIRREKTVESDEPLVCPRLPDAEREGK